MIIRKAHHRRFTVVERSAINDARLSLRARGLLVWLLDKPDGWNINSTQIGKVVPEGRDAIRRALQELEAAGYVKREKVRGERGQWITETFVYECPEGEERPTTDYQASDARPSENQALSTKDCRANTVIGKSYEVVSRCERCRAYPFDCVCPPEVRLSVIDGG